MKKKELQSDEKKGRIEGRTEGEAGLILKMYKNGLVGRADIPATDKQLEEVKEIIAGI